MPFQKGYKPTKSRKGAQNKTTVLLEKIQARLRGDPIEKLCDIAKNPEATLELKAKVLIEITKYCYAQKKSIEVTGENGGPIQTLNNNVDITPEKILEAVMKARKCAGDQQTVR